MTYRLTLDIFEGPLDLLLYLIKKNDLDIADIPIAEITDQYMEYIEMMKILDLEVVGEFLVMAATLMHLKSKMLLPPDPNQEEPEEDPRDELVKRLQEYKLFKEIAEQLRTKEQDRQDLYSRQQDEERRKELQEDAKEVFFEANLFDLINAFTKVVSRFKKKGVYEIEERQYTVDEKVHEILHTLLERPRLILSEFLEKAECRMEAIVSFIAILELIRLKEIKVIQKRMFGEIEVVRNKENLIPSDQQ